MKFAITAQYAGFLLRFAAFCIDLVVISAGLFILQIFVGIGSIPIGIGGHFLNNMLPFTPAVFSYNFVAVVAVWLYYACFESSSWQATLGKRFCKIKVMDYNGHRISFLRATGRYFAKYLSALIFCIGYLMIMFTDKKQALHDFIASTLVVRD